LTANHDVYTRPLHDALPIYCILFNADCLAVLPTLGKVDAVVTDPPYGIGAANGAAKGGTDASGRYVRRPREYAGSWDDARASEQDRKSTRLNSSHVKISYAV